MAVFKCKMCGGTIEFDQGATVGICDSCGTKQTLPRLDDERKENLYDRANHFRRNNEFDKAMDIYEKILNEDTTDAEAYWSLVLCNYGIEYVEDPITHKRVPTVNRAQFTSIFDDDNYKSAIEHADSIQRELYENEAKVINDIQKEILAISQKEDPFDVFICYKQTDDNGKRTYDSVLANDLYHQLVQEDFKVFFARITLEDKLGTAYEPYIFAALNSAKVMVVIGTKPEYFNAVWVKNEWSRYLSIVKKSGGKKILIPAYKDMDPYDLPNEFSHLQAQDMSKLGFMQDLIRGIKKIVKVDDEKSRSKETIVLGGGNKDTTPLLERAFLFLEDSKWVEANTYCEKVLDIDPKNAKAYLGKLMAELEVKHQEDLVKLDNPFDDRENYEKVIRFADLDLSTKIQGYIDQINERNENNRLTSIYNEAMSKLENAHTEKEYKDIAEQFKSISGFKDSDVLAEDCLEKSEISRKDEIYNNAITDLNTKNVLGYKSAISKLKMIPGWKDADELLAEYKSKVDDADKKIKKLIPKVVIGLIIILIFYSKIIIPKQKFDNEIKTLSTSEIGDTITFGLYEQDGNKMNGKEVIDWIVLEKKDNRALLVSKYSIECMKYNLTDMSVTWESCSLRKWLNNDFINKAFSFYERKQIINTLISPVNNINDKIFLLSQNERIKYHSVLSRVRPTISSAKKYEYYGHYEQIGYDIDNTSIIENKAYEAYIDWWLRDTEPSGRALTYDWWDVGGPVTSKLGVRPALWVKIK